MTSILHVITGLGTGGAETMLAQLAAGLQTRGLPQHVISMKSPGPVAERLESGGVPVTSLGLNSPWGAPAACARLVRLVRREDPGILQGWMYHGNLAAAIAHRAAPRRRDRKLFWNIRASNMDADRYAGIIRWSARLSHWPDLVIANSQAGMGFHLASGFQPLNRAVIPNGIDTNKFKPDANARRSVRNELGLAAKDVAAIKVARVDPMKDHGTFLAAMRALPKVRGLLAGLGTDTLDLPDNVMALGLREDVARLCAAADIVVSSSAYGEGFSNALAEGMSAGLVPVATRTGDSAVIVGDTGAMVEPGDADALAVAIGEIAALPAPKLAARGKRARQRIETEFSLGGAIDAFERLYREADAPGG